MAQPPLIVDVSTNARAVYQIDPLTGLPLVVAAGGDASAANQVLQLAQETAIAASASVLDDWDESDRAKVNPIVGQAGLAGGAGAPTANTVRIVQANSASIPAGAPTYTAVGVGYTAYATPTDLLCIRGSATKTIAITALAIAPQATAAALGSFYWIKRSTANTGGTSTNPTAIPYDSGDAAATAVIDLYTAAPTTGSAVGNVGIIIGTIQATTAVPNWTNFPASTNLNTSMGDALSAVDLRKPIILRGIAEMLCLNFNGAGIAVGFTAGWMVKWIEF